MRELPREHLADVAAILKQRVGLHIRPDGFGALKLALSARLDDLDGRLPAGRGYLALLCSDEGDEELRRLLPLVTVGKTSFFRDERQFAALDALLPELLRRPRAGGPPVAIWSAGCATGEEPYSIAMSAALAGALPREVEILATDVNPEAVAAATGGVFSPRRAKEIPAEHLARWFVRGSDGYAASPELCAYLRGVERHNLVSSIFPRPASGGWDVVFCRNVIIYFDTATAQAVLAKLLAALVPGGYLFLGYSESLFRLFDGFDLAEVAGAFVYRRPGGEPQSSRPPRPVRATAPHPRPGLPSPAPAPDAARRTPAPASPEPCFERAVQLFTEGRFGAARELLERLLAGGSEDLAVRLTLANLYGVLQQPDLARQHYQAALATEPLCAEGHLFYGIHLLGSGEADAAALELSRALFLDPDLALAHYFLGRCRELQRDPDRARLSYRNAIDAQRRSPPGKRPAFLGYYPDVPTDGSALARAAECAIAAL